LILSLSYQEVTNSYFYCNFIGYDYIPRQNQVNIIQQQPQIQIQVPANQPKPYTAADLYQKAPFTADNIFQDFLNTDLEQKKKGIQKLDKKIDYNTINEPTKKMLDKLKKKALKDPTSAASKNAERAKKEAAEALRIKLGDPERVVSDFQQVLGDDD
jgi:hypothetical protein